MKVMSEAEIAKGRRVVAKHNIRMAAPYVAFVVIGILCVSLFVALHINKMRRDDADFANAPVHMGTAIVSFKHFTYTKSGVFVTFQFLVGGQRLSTGDPGGLRTILTNVGDTVAITYRIGKSGAYDLVDWQAPPRKMSLPR